MQQEGSTECLASESVYRGILGSGLTVRRCFAGITIKEHRHCLAAPRIFGQAISRRQLKARDHGQRHNRAPDEAHDAGNSATCIAEAGFNPTLERGAHFPDQCECDPNATQKACQPGGFGVEGRNSTYGTGNERIETAAPRDRQCESHQAIDFIAQPVFAPTPEAKPQKGQHTYVCSMHARIMP